MTKLLFNRRKLIEVDDERILRGFAESYVRKEYNDSPEEVRLILFVAFDEPVGLGSTFRSSKEFNALFDKWCTEKNKFIPANEVKIKRRIK